MPHVDGENPDDTPSAAEKLAALDTNLDLRGADSFNPKLDRFSTRVLRTGHSFLMVRRLPLQEVTQIDLPSRAIPP